MLEATIEGEVSSRAHLLVKLSFRQVFISFSCVVCGACQFQDTVVDSCNVLLGERTFK